MSYVFRVLRAHQADVDHYHHCGYYHAGEHDHHRGAGATRKHETDARAARWPPRGWTGRPRRPRVKRSAAWHRASTFWLKYVVAATWIRHGYTHTVQPHYPVASTNYPDCSKTKKCTLTQDFKREGRVCQGWTQYEAFTLRVGEIDG